MSYQHLRRSPPLSAALSAPLPPYLPTQLTPGLAGRPDDRGSSQTHLHQAQRPITADARPLPVGNHCHVEQGPAPVDRVRLGRPSTSLRLRPKHGTPPSGLLRSNHHISTRTSTAGLRAVPYPLRRIFGPAPSRVATASEPARRSVLERTIATALEMQLTLTCIIPSPVDSGPDPFEAAFG